MLVVVVIIGILAVALIPRLVGAKERASDSARIVKVSQISSAVELYAQEKGTTYPLAPLTTTGTSIARQDITDAISPYLTTIPTDPGKWTVAIDSPPSNIQVTGDSFAYWTNTGWTVYAITALMESKKGNTTNATQLIDSDKQGAYQKVGKWLTTNIVVAGWWAEPAEAWIYHIWDTIVVKSGEIRYVIADKNAGIGVVAGTWTASYGDHYQRGNNHWFPSVPALYEPKTNVETVDTSTYSRSNPYDNNIWRYDDMSYFGNSRYDWSTDQNDDLRWGITQTNIARKWPCGDWYHVPTYDDWMWLVDLRASLKGETITYSEPGYKEFSVPDAFGTDLLLPKAGGRDYGSAGSVGDQGDYGLYWSSTPNGTDAYHLTFDSSRVSAYFDYYRAYGFSVRCFENSSYNPWHYPWHLSIE